MHNRLSKILALTGVSAVLAIGGAGVAQAITDHRGHRHDDHHCKKLHGSDAVGPASRVSVVLGPLS